MNPVRIQKLDEFAQTLVRVLAVLLCAVAVIWVLIDRSAWTACLVLAGAAIPLAILGGD